MFSNIANKFSFINRKFIIYLLITIFIILSIIFYDNITIFKSTTTTSASNNNNRILINIPLIPRIKESSSSSDAPVSTSPIIPTIINLPPTIPLPGPFDSELVITVLTGSGVAEERLPVLYRLFKSYKIPETQSITIVMFNDKPLDDKFYASVPGIHFLTVNAESCGNGQQDALCCKTAMSYEWVFQKMSKIKWIMRATDDTFVHIPNLLCYLNTLNSKDLIYTGERYQHSSHDYLDGGAGWVISAALLVKMSSNFRGFVRTGGCYDDVHFGQFMRSMGVSPLQAYGFHNELFVLDDNKLKVIPYPEHGFHKAHTELKARVITFHMRYGAQAGMGGTKNNKITEETYFLLKSRVDELTELPCSA